MAETQRCTRVLRVITAMGDLRQRREKQGHAARTAANWLFLNLLDETGLWQQSKGRHERPATCCTPILPGFFGRDAPTSNEKGEPGASSVGRTQQREKSSHDSGKKFRLMRHGPQCR